MNSVTFLQSDKAIKSTFFHPPQSIVGNAISCFGTDHQQADGQLFQKCLDDRTYISKVQDRAMQPLKMHMNCPIKTFDPFKKNGKKTCFPSLTSHDT